MCNSKDFANFPDKRLQRSLCSFKIRCSHYKDGCAWIGELQKIDMHLNRNPLTENRHDGCPFIEVTCDFYDVGCRETIPRIDMQEHLRENVAKHMSLFIDKQKTQLTSLTTDNKSLRTDNEILRGDINSMKQSQASLQKDCNALKEENKKLKQEVDALVSRGNISVVPSALVSRGNISVVPSALLAMNNFHQLRRRGEIWYSPPVYTYHQGYKVCLKIFADGNQSAKGAYVTASIVFMRGEFDDSLKWPFRGEISFRLLDRSKAEDHIIYPVIIDKHNDSDGDCSRVTEGEKRVLGWGPTKFIAHTELKPKYLQNNALLFQIHKAEMY